MFHHSDDIVTRCEKAPPMVSRRFVYVDGLLFEPLFMLSRVAKRLTSCEQRDADMERTLVQAYFTTVALPIYWHTRLDPAYYSPVIEMVVREFGTTEVLGLARNRAGELYAYRSRQEEPIPAETRFLYN